MKHQQAAIKLLKALDEKRCDYSDTRDNFLTHCTEAYHNPTHHIALIYADYFYLEALFKLKGNDVLLWQSCNAYKRCETDTNQPREKSA